MWAGALWLAVAICGLLHVSLSAFVVGSVLCVELVVIALFDLAAFAHPNADGAQLDADGAQLDDGGAKPGTIHPDIVGDAPAGTAERAERNTDGGRRSAGPRPRVLRSGDGNSDPSGTSLR